MGVALVRPEQLRLVDAGVTGTVRAISFHGHDALLTVDVDETGLRLSVRVAAPLRVVPGEQVGLAVSGPVTFYPSGGSSAAAEGAVTEG
jgi:iron(III) transport system ATP-binding protein